MALSKPLPGSTGLKAWLAVFVLLAASPLLAMLVTVAVSDHQAAIAEARSQVLRSARLAAERQDDELVEAFSLLRALALVPAVTSAAEPCHTILQDIADDHPHMDALAVFGSGGGVTCHSILATPGISVAGRDFFTAIMAPNGPEMVQGRLGVGMVTGRPTVSVVLALPPDRPGGSPTGGVLASLNLQYFSRLAAGSVDREARTVLVIDTRDGAVLAHAPEHTSGHAPAAPPPALLRAVRAIPADGILQQGGVIWGLAPLRTPGTSAVVAIGLPVSSVLAGADNRLVIGLVLALAVACCAAISAQQVAQHVLVGPLARLASAARRLGEGRPGARTGLANGCPAQITAFAATLDGVAASIEARDAALREMQEGLAMSEAHHRLLAEHATDMIIRYTPDGTRRYVSPASMELLGLRPEELTGHRSLQHLLPEDQAGVRAMLDSLRDHGGVQRRDVRCTRKDGEVIFVEITARSLGAGQDIVASVRDAKARRQLEQQLALTNAQLEVMAMQDGLTALANRRQFDDALAREFRRAKRTGARIGLVMIDVDRFKGFNDRYGHPAGDACLRRVAAAVRGCIHRPGDLAARYGGEELAVLLPGTGEAGCLDVAERICVAVRALEIEHAGNARGVVTVSAGVASVAAGAGDTRALVDAADRALYAAKHGGRDRVRAAERELVS